ncbi:hypothetical protein D5086_001157, partial [Populus alba]
TCPHALPPMEPNADHGNSTWGVDWNYYWIGFGCGGGMGLNIGYAIAMKRMPSQNVANFTLQ